VPHLPLIQLVVLGAMAAGAGVVRWMEPQRRARRKLARVPLRRIEDLKDGDHARVVATVLEGTSTYTSPVTDRACVAYRFIIEEKPLGSEWRTVARQTTCPPSLTLVDGGSELSVEGPFLFGLDFDDAGETSSNLPAGVFRVLAQAGASPAGPFGSEKKIRFREAILRPGDRVAVCGRATVEVKADGTREQRRGPPLHRSLRGGPGEPVVIGDAPGS
jgi:hypothetical protein